MKILAAYNKGLASGGREVQFASSASRFRHSLRLTGLSSRQPPERQAAKR